MSNCCPTCNRPMPKPRAIKATGPVDTATMTDDQLRKHYAKIAPVENVRAFGERTSARTPADMARQQRVAVLLSTLAANGGKDTPATKQEYQSILADWRRARMDAERAERPHVKVHRNAHMLMLTRTENYGVQQSLDSCRDVNGKPNAYSYTRGWSNCVIRTEPKQLEAVA